MKQTLLLTALLATALASPAHAQDIKPYIGVDFQHTAYGLNNSYDLDGVTVDGDKILSDSLNGFNLHVGNRFNQYFAAELGVFYNKKNKKNIATGDDLGHGIVAATDFSTGLRTYGMTLDGIGYLPLNEQFDLLGTAGVSWTKAKASMNIPGAADESDSKSELGFRLGGGAQVNFTPDVSLRGLIRYQTADFSDIAERAWVSTVGVNYSF